MTVYVTLPSNIGEINVKRASAWLAEENTQLEDITPMIDLSLLTKDKEWFKQLKADLSLREQWILYHATKTT